MEILESRVDPASDEFRANADHHRKLADELSERLASVREGGGAESRARREERGTLFVRARSVALVVDASGCVEVAHVASWGR
jgi:acetyl-CoA carboxylase carboxyltransferase component